MKGSEYSGLQPAVIKGCVRCAADARRFAPWLLVSLLLLVSCIGQTPGLPVVFSLTPTGVTAAAATPGATIVAKSRQVEGNETASSQALAQSESTEGLTITKESAVLPSTPDCDCIPTLDAPFDPASWEALPVIPQLDSHARVILAAGLARGNNPRAFSKIGDCESRTTWFLGNFDLGEQYYHLGPYADTLSPVVEYYAGSFNRLSQAANPGFTAASLLSPLRADPKACEKNETPLACEYRQHRPAVALIMLGTNDAVTPKTFEGHMRKIIEFTLAQDILPILGTKADNIEGDHRINQTIARLAHEYDLPLWNFWRAAQELPSRGLQEDGAHLTYAEPFFDNPAVLKRAWPVRNLNALQILHETMQATDAP